MLGIVRVRGASSAAASARASLDSADSTPERATDENSVTGPVPRSRATRAWSTAAAKPSYDAGSETPMRTSKRSAISSIGPRSPAGTDDHEAVVAATEEERAAPFVDAQLEQLGDSRRRAPVAASVSATSTGAGGSGPHRSRTIRRARRGVARQQRLHERPRAARRGRG